MSEQSALVIATFSRRMRLRLDNGQEIEARIKGKRLRPVCGDNVVAEPIDGESDWLITSIEPRSNELTRPTLRGKVEVLASNIDALVIIAAAAPMPDWFIVDRYICAAEIMGASPIVVFNKVDLLEGHDIEIIELDEYRDIGLPVLETSAENGTGTDAVLSAVAGRCAIVVGQSGVGKSSLINQLTADAKQRTAAISNKTGEGRHTTVNSVMIYLNNGSQVIDSPGVRDYAPALESASDAAQGFREIAALAERCRFANCRHLREPGCAVKDAVENERISERRYQSYKRMINLTERLASGKY